MDTSAPPTASAGAYDYVVVGSGAAGAVVAARLSASGRYRVLVLEAGKHDDWHWLRVPAGVAWVLLDERAVQPFATQPEPALGGRSIPWPRGRVVGGTSRINGMIWVQGDPEEYDRWAAQGCAGWGREDVLPVFRDIERMDGPADEGRGRAGPMHVHRYGPRDPLSEAFVGACEQAGIPRNPDYNGRRYDGAGYLQLNTHRGLRHSVYEAYLEPALGRRNLQLLTGAEARSVVFDGARAAGVRFLHRGRMHEASAMRQVVLCAGALQTPPLLERSGIGDHDRLRALGIRVQAHRPGVGENLRDHLQTRIALQSTGSTTLNDLMWHRMARWREVLRYALRRDGLLSSASCTAQALAALAPGGRAEVKLQLYHLTGSQARDSRQFVLDRASGFSIGMLQLRPESTGSVHLAARDAGDPQIRANYLSAEADRRTAVDAFRLARRLLEQPALRPFIVRELGATAQLRSDDEILQHVRSTGSTSYHPVGSCRMGDDPQAVVDARLRVHDVPGLRIADASVMPTMVSSNSHAPTVMIGERAARFILEEAAAAAR